MPPKKKDAVVAQETKVESKSILRLILSLNSNKPQLDFGINLDCRLIKIDNTVRVKEGKPIERNTFLTFAKYNKKNEIIGQSEFNFFNLDPESKYTFENFVEQLSKLTTLCNLLSPGSAYDPTEGYESPEEIEADLKAPKTCKALQDKMYEEFEKIVADKVGPESPLLALKVVTEKTGKYLQLPREDKFCGLMDKDYSFLRITPYELKMKDAALSPQIAEADPKGDAPVKKSNTLAGL